MAGEAGATADNVAAAAASAAAQTEAKIAAVETAANAAVEHAEQRVEAAQEVAEKIADAALMSELGKRVEDTRKEVSEKCDANSVKIQTLETGMSALQSQVTGLTAQITEALAKLSTLQPLAASTPPPSPKVEETILPKAETPPAGESAAQTLENGAARVEQIVKRRRWM